jgi:septum formation protein
MAHMKNPEIILASASPRRRELLNKAVKMFEIIPSAFDEKKIKDKDPVQFAVKASICKAIEVGNRYPSAIVIGADTIVVLKNRIFGKPKNSSDAKRALRSLSGKTHQVITGVAICFKDGDKLISAYESTDVTFKVLSDKEIDDYVSEGSVHDKAGSYAIQDIGGRFIDKIKGDYDNVVGLPVALVIKLLAEFLG